MNVSKRALIAGATIAAVGMAGAGSIGMASAATTSNSDSTSIVDKIATKFNLDKDEVQAVFDEERSEHHAEMKQERQERLAQAVKDGKLTQAQADHITAAMDEIESLMGSARPDEQSDEVHEQIRSKMEALRTWAEQNNVDVPLMMGVRHHGGPGGPGRSDHFEVKLDGGSQSSSDSQDN